MNKKLEIKKILQNNLPIKSENDIIFFTSDKKLYITDKQGSPIEISDFEVTNSKDCENTKNKIPHKFYLGEDNGTLFYFNGSKMISIKGQKIEINSVGGGASLLKSYNDSIKLKTIKAGDNVNIVEGTDELIISSSLTGETTTSIKFDKPNIFDFQEDKFEFKGNEVKLKAPFDDNYHVIHLKDENLLSTKNWYQINFIIIKSNLKDIKWLFTNDNKNYFTRKEKKWIDVKIEDIGTQGMTSDELKNVFTNYQWEQGLKYFGLACAFKGTEDNVPSLQEIGFNILMLQTDSGKVGTKSVDESKISEKSFLYYDGKNVSYSQYPFLQEWQQNKDYKEGMFFIYENKLFKCIKDLENSIEFPTIDKKHFQLIVSESQENSKTQNRNFVENPINLENEVGGRLSEDRIQINNLMSRKDYDQDNDNMIDISKEAIKIKDSIKAEPLSYYGKDRAGNIGFHIFPIGSKDEKEKESGIQQILKENVMPEKTFKIDFLDSKFRDHFIIQCYKKMPGEKDVSGILKNYDSYEKDSFYYDKKNISFHDNLEIKYNHKIKYNYVEKKNNKYIFKSDEINLSDFKELNNIQEE